MARIFYCETFFGFTLRKFPINFFDFLKLKLNKEFNSAHFITNEFSGLHLKNVLFFNLIDLTDTQII